MKLFVGQNQESITAYSNHLLFATATMSSNYGGVSDRSTFALGLERLHGYPLLSVEFSDMYVCMPRLELTMCGEASQCLLRREIIQTP